MLVGLHEFVVEYQEPRALHQFQSAEAQDFNACCLAVNLPILILKIIW